MLARACLAFIPDLPEPGSARRLTVAPWGLRLLLRRCAAAAAAACTVGDRGAQPSPLRVEAAPLPPARDINFGLGDLRRTDFAFSLWRPEPQGERRRTLPAATGGVVGEAGMRLLGSGDAARAAPS